VLKLRINSEGILTIKSTKNMKNKRLLTRIDAVDRLQYYKQDKNKEKQNSSNPKPELEFEIECPRCLDIMILSSNFDNLYYFCEGVRV
jgi:hypothetical protein